MWGESGIELKEFREISEFREGLLAIGKSVGTHLRCLVGTCLRHLMGTQAELALWGVLARLWIERGYAPSVLSGYVP